MPARSRAYAGIRGDVRPFEHNAAGRSSMGAGDRAKQRSLSCSVRANQRQRLTGCDRERDAAHRLQETVTRVQLLYAKEAHRAALPPI